MRSKSKKSLSLSKETIKELTAREMKSVAGATVAGTNCGTTEYGSVCCTHVISCNETDCVPGGGHKLI